MKILVYDVAAENGGALSILENVYKKAKDVYKENEWIFVISLPQLNECDNIKILRYPKVKKSWIHRYIFDKTEAVKIINSYNPDLILNLQNIAIKTKKKQILYVHQSIPFFDYKFNFFKESKVWIYKNIIGRMIKKSCKDVDEIIVQTQWMKKAIIEKTKANEDKITVQPPEIEKKDLKQYNELNNINLNEKIFFYPANASIYKNHKVIVDACKILNQKGISYNVLFTLKGDENKNTVKLNKISKENNLSIRWLGYISKEKVFDLYSKSILLFPSYVETFGLPLLEARESNTPIIAADTPFSNEICKNYNKVNYFNYKDCNQLADLMEKI